MATIKKAISGLYLIPMLAGILAPGPARAEWGIGPLGGANVSNAAVDGHSTRSVTGWAVGARLEMGMAPILSLMFDPMLVRTGARFDATDGSGEGMGRFTSMEIPMLLNAKVRLLNIGVYGFLGPDLVFNTDAGSNHSEANDLEGSAVNPVAFAGQIGAGVSMGVAPSIDVTADARYSHGFTDLVDGAKGDVDNWRTRDVRLNLGVLLHTAKLKGLVSTGKAAPGNAYRSLW
jgi:outer membrane protein with beta-barrel domain